MTSERVFKTLVFVLPLVALVAFVSQFAVAQDADGKEYVGTTQCKVCHNKKSEGAQYDVWKSMKHSEAFELLKSDAALEVAKARGMSEKPSESAQCLKCHVTSYDPETQSIHPKISMEDGVGCESCHGPASAHLDDGKKLMMKKGEGIDVLANIVRPDASTCTQCHNEENPNWDPEKYTLENGEKVGFDFEQAYAIIAHPNPEKQDDGD
jgi:hypothetical protein